MNPNHADEFTRRSLLANIAKSALGVTLLPMTGASIAHGADFVPNRPRAARSVIFLMMSGGMSHLDTLDVMGKKADVLGKTKAIDTSASGMKLSENLPKTAKQMHHIALLNGMNTTQGAHARHHRPPSPRVMGCPPRRKTEQ
jgi:hypothetical protein